MPCCFIRISSIYSEDKFESAVLPDCMRELSAMLRISWWYFLVMVSGSIHEGIKSYPVLLS